MAWPDLVILHLLHWTLLYALRTDKTVPKRPNLVLFITDDQDLLLGSMEFMPKTLKFLRKRGVEFENAFVSTPMCCPSRTTILSGLYAHNHNVMTNNLNCAGKEWREVFEKQTFAVHLKGAGYKTAFFGKYLNEYDGSYIPPGWDHWMGLVRNSRFYNYTVNRNGMKEKHGFDYKDDYLTDLITNGTLEFIERQFVEGSDQPFLIVLSYPAPHGPEDPAPQYTQLFEDNNTHRTPSWNYAPNPDKQWILQHTGKMEPVHVYFTDLLHRRRLQTLQSVDDSVHKVMSLMRNVNFLHNTYTLFTSDHGYHLGQFGLIKGKSMPYEFDIRVPFFMRGPDLPKGEIRREPIVNIDIAPTLLDVARVERPASMNGRSLLEIFQTQPRPAWRETVLVERGKMPRLKKIGERFRKQKENYSKYLMISRQCSKAKYEPPCKSEQEWVCVRNSIGRWRILRCQAKCNCRRKRNLFGKAETNGRIDWDGLDPDAVPSLQLDQWEDQFVREHYEQELIESGEWFQGLLSAEDPASRSRREIEIVPESDLEDRCVFKSKQLCDIPRNITRKQWDRKKLRVDLKIQKLKDRISAIKDIRKQLRESRPTQSVDVVLSDNVMEKECECGRPMPYSKHPMRIRENCD